MPTNFEGGGETVGSDNGEADGLSEGRRDFLKGTLAVGGIAASLGMVGVPPSPLQRADQVIE